MFGTHIFENVYLFLWCLYKQSRRKSEEKQKIAYLVSCWWTQSSISVTEQLHTPDTLESVLCARHVHDVLPTYLTVFLITETKVSLLLYRIKCCWLPWQKLLRLNRFSYCISLKFKISIKLVKVPYYAFTRVTLIVSECNYTTIYF